MKLKNKHKKKILLLGASKQQIPSIIKARELGYYVVTCDYLPDNPGHVFADESYNISTTDKEAVLELAKRIGVSGIVCYASDPSAPTAAYVAEKLRLPTSPYESVEILANKDLFREFLKKNHFATPKSVCLTDLGSARLAFREFKSSVIIKPTDSSGSKGVELIEREEELKASFARAMSYSRVGKIIMEEYIESVGYQIAGDGFSVNGELVFRCFGNDHFDKENSNPFVPVAASFPCNLSEEVQNKIHNEIQRLLTLLDMKDGAYNFDIKIDSNGNIYLMEVGPRNGGNYLPQIIECVTGIDLTKYTVMASMGEDLQELTMSKIEGCFAYYALHSDVEGILKDIWIDESVKNNNITHIYMNYQIGDMVPLYSGSNGTIGILIMKFTSQKEMCYMLEHTKEWIELRVE